jgi:hypothetical protein
MNLELEDYENPMQALRMKMDVKMECDNCRNIFWLHRSQFGLDMMFGNEWQEDFMGPLQDYFGVELDKNEHCGRETRHVCKSKICQGEMHLHTARNYVTELPEVLIISLSTFTDADAPVDSEAVGLEVLEQLDRQGEVISLLEDNICKTEFEIEEETRDRLNAAKKTAEADF